MACSVPLNLVALSESDAWGTQPESSLTRSFPTGSKFYNSCIPCCSYSSPWNDRTDPFAHLMNIFHWLCGVSFHLLFHTQMFCSWSKFMWETRILHQPLLPLWLLVAFGMVVCECTPLHGIRFVELSLILRSWMYLYEYV